MALSSKECTQYIAEWVRENEHLLPSDGKDWSMIPNKKLREEWRQNAFKPNKWKRRAKATLDGKIYRAFEGEHNLFDINLIIVLEETDSKITNIEIGTRKDFEGKYFTRIGDYCG